MVMVIYQGKLQNTYLCTYYSVVIIVKEVEYVILKVLKTNDVNERCSETLLFHFISIINNFLSISI